MPIHDWSKAPPGLFHHLHGSWIFELAGRLNDGLLPAGFYALGEQVIGGVVPDVLALEQRSAATAPPSAAEAIAVPEPTATLTASAEMPEIAPRPRVLAIRHASNDRVVAVAEIVSPGNKKESAELGALIEKTVAMLAKGVHVVVIDLLPQTPLAPDGLAIAAGGRQPEVAAVAARPPEEAACDVVGASRAATPWRDQRPPRIGIHSGVARTASIRRPCSPTASGDSSASRSSRSTGGGRWRR